MVVTWHDHGNPRFCPQRSTAMHAQPPIDPPTPGRPILLSLHAMEVCQREAEIVPIRRILPGGQVERLQDELCRFVVVAALVANDT